MKTSKVVGIILVIGALLLGYLGISTFSESTASAEVLGLELNASDQGGQTTGILYLVGGAILLIAGIYSINKK